MLPNVFSIETSTHQAHNIGFAFATMMKFARAVSLHPLAASNWFGTRAASSPKLRQTDSGIQNSKFKIHNLISDVGSTSSSSGMA